MGKTVVPMTEGEIWKRITYFALPLMLGNLFQQMYNTADSLIVGNFLGSNALAAVSSSSSLIFMLIGLFSGLASGAAGSGSDFATSSAAPFEDPPDELSAAVSGAASPACASFCAAIETTLLLGIVTVPKSVCKTNCASVELTMLPVILSPFDKPTTSARHVCASANTSTTNCNLITLAKTIFFTLANKPQKATAHCPRRPATTNPYPRILTFPRLSTSIF